MALHRSTRPRREKGLPPAKHAKSQGIELGEQQKEALIAIEAFLADPVREVFLLSGYAGTGKSTLCRHLLEQQEDLKVVLTATTNKAVEVLQNLVERRDCRCETTHRLLKRCPVEDADGSLRWERRGRPDLDGVDLVVVDECSMVDVSLWSHLQDLPVGFPGIKLIFMGDPAQLPPVGEDTSCSFDLPDRFRLTEIHRQGLEHPALLTSLRLRLQLEDPEAALPQWAEGEELVIHREPKSFEAAHRECEDRPVVLAYTNARVQHWIRCLDPHRYRGRPFDEKQPLLLTRAVVKEDFSGRREVLATTDTPVRMRSSRSLDWRGLSLWNLELADDSGRVLNGPYVAPDQKEAFEEALDVASQEAMEKPLSRPAFEKWKRSFLGVQSATAITVHRSQGSTFDRVFLDLPSFRACRDRSTLLRLLYVAVTRTKGRLDVLWADLD